MKTLLSVAISLVLLSSTLGATGPTTGTTVQPLTFGLSQPVAEPTTPPVTQPVLFGMQDCVNGYCPAPTRTRTPVFSRQRTVTRSFGMPSASVVTLSAPVVQQTVEPVKVLQTIRTQKTRMVEKEIQVPVTIMETRTIQEPETYWVEEQRECLVCPQNVTVALNYCPPQQTYYQPQPMYYQPQTVSVTNVRSRTRSAGPIRSFFSRFRLNVSARRGMSASTGWVYPPSGQDVFSHLQNDHGINTDGMSYSAAMALHTSLH